MGANQRRQRRNQRRGACSAGDCCVCRDYVFVVPSPARAQFTVPGVPGTWLNDGHVFAGIDYTRNQSPQCQSGGFDDRSTSNMGFKANVWQSPSKNVRFNLMYTHHSCALNPDRNSYDAIGAQVEWFIWNRY